MKKFNAFEKVLVRVNRTAPWSANLYDHLTGDGHLCIASISFTCPYIKDENILPYIEETKHLLGTTKEFKIWNPKKGEPILVKNFRDSDKNWTVAIFLKMYNNRYTCTQFITSTDGKFVCPEENILYWDQAKPVSLLIQE